MTFGQASMRQVGLVRLQSIDGLASLMPAAWHMQALVERTKVEKSMVWWTRRRLDYTGPTAGYKVHHAVHAGRMHQACCKHLARCLAD